MEIVWLGHSCFRLRGKESTVITDPCPPETGYTIGRQQADVVTVSHAHPGHSYIQAVTVGGKVLNRPGEYEVRDVLAVGWSTWHDDVQGRANGRNIVFYIEIDGVRILHMGDIGHIPAWEMMPEASSIDVLFLPVGGGRSVSVPVAAQIMRHLSPKIVIPMHYWTPATRRQLEPLDKFLRETGSGGKEPVSKLTVHRTTLPSDGTQVVVLACPQK
ncbi:MAG: MBL fold metallo-hydrolase [Dehalococcoidia bacterium]|nr:MBL fold metallo-hydrolase [Dehalococcoidia bacterium]